MLCEEARIRLVGKTGPSMKKRRSYRRSRNKSIRNVPYHDFNLLLELETVTGLASSKGLTDRLLAHGMACSATYQNSLIE